MTVIKGAALALALATAGALTHAGVTGSSTMPSVKLKAITARIGANGAQVVIEATEPVPYLASRPDPMTIVLEFRNVDAQSLVNKFAVNTKSPVSGVTVENADELGVPASRVRIALAEAVAHRVRSDKNTVVVEFEKANGKSVPYVMPPASRAAVEAVDPLSPGSDAGDPIAALNLQRLAPSRAAASTSQAVGTSASAQTPSQPADQPEPVAAGKKYTGAPMTLDFVDADLKTVLRAFAQENGLNIVIDPGVTGTVNVQLTAVPWDQALDVILRENKLDYRLDGPVVRIAPRDVFTAEDKSVADANDARALSGDLHFLTKTLSYAKADDLKALLLAALSKRGTIQVDPRTNTVILQDLQPGLDAASALIAILDRAQSQVEIEARIVQANKNYARALGVQWGFNGTVSPALGNTTNLAFPNSGSLSGTQGAAGQSSVVNLPAIAPSGTNLSGVGLALGSVNGAFNLDVALSAAETHGQVRILSTPRVSTQNNGEAEIKQGVQIPIQVVSNNTTTVSFRDAALILHVTPQITAVGTVIMKINIENSSPDFSKSVNGIPPINTQAATTLVQVNDGQTTVIGGIYASTQTTQNDGTPGLSRIPFFNWLFKRDSSSDVSQELLIFITPRIIRD
jgi:type IV pilus assembly protein PilQ